MTELDFDELDKAVNSLMAENDTPAVPLPAPQPSDVPAADSSAAPPSVSESAPAAAVPATSPAVRRRGQFMDVIHPSANMRPVQPAANRQAADIAPPVTEVPTQPETVENTVPAEAVPSVAAEPQTAPVTAVPSIEPSTPPVAVLEEPVAQAETSSPEDPQTSPFLADAKVEKRPLGSPLGPFDTEPEFGTSMADESSAMPGDDVQHDDAAVAEAPLTADVQEAPEDSAQTVPAPAEPVLPDELKEDIVTVEANVVSHEDVIAETPSPEVSETPATEPAPAAAEGAGTILPQYTEQPSTGDQTSGAIFDTNAYHQPLGAEAAKKKPPVLTWILWIVVLLIVGATAGAAWFYFTTQ